MYACVYRPPECGLERRDRKAREENSVQDRDSARSAISAFQATDELIAIAREFSPRFESRGDAVTIDVRGLDRLLGDARAIGEELRREAARRGVRVHVAVAATQTAAAVLAMARPGLTVIPAGAERETLAPLGIGILEKIGCDHDDDDRPVASGFSRTSIPENAAISAFKIWGLTTLGEIAALPSADLASRLGAAGLRSQALARGEDVRPLVPDAAEERFESSFDLEWPIEDLEPMSFVLTRLLEPLSIRLERRDRGVAVLHVRLGLVGGDLHARRLELPSPMRDVRTLRTLALLDLESHPPAAAIDRVVIVVDPTPGRVVQHTLFAHPQLTPEQLSTLLARLGAVMGQDRIGSPAAVDSYRPGAFEMKPFAPNDLERRDRKDRREKSVQQENSAISALSAFQDVALRRCRQPVPARVAAGADSRPVRVTTDRRGFAGGTVMQVSGPWLTSGEWWTTGQAGLAGRAGQAGKNVPDRPDSPGQPDPRRRFGPPAPVGGWDREEWDVTLNDGGSYRVFRDRITGGWFIDAICD